MYWIIYVFSIFNLKNVDKILFFAYINFTLTNTIDGYSLYPSSNSPKSNIPDVLKDLTDTELGVLTEYCKTLDRDEVVKKLGISVRTLKSHISSIYEKTGYNNLAKLAIYCVGNGLIVPNLETPKE